MCAKLPPVLLIMAMSSEEKIVDAIFNNLLAAETAEEEEARRQTDDGRYICFFPGCNKTFASKGKRMRDHETTHNQQVPALDTQGLLFASEGASIISDSP